MNHLQQLLAELAKDFGKSTRWQLLCQEQNATSEADQIRLAEQVLAEPPLGGVAAAHSHWARLHGAKSKPAPPYNPTGF
jgi:hypothetical protein